MIMIIVIIVILFVNISLSCDLINGNDMGMLRRKTLTHTIHTPKIINECESNLIPAI